MNSNEISDTNNCEVNTSAVNTYIANTSTVNTSTVNTSTVGTKRRINKQNGRNNRCSPRRSKRTRTQVTNNTNLNNSMTAPTAMGSLISVSIELNNQNIEPNEETVAPNESQVSTENPNQMPETSDAIDVCIDLTEDDSVVENNTESDSEIQCISTVSNDSDLCIVRDFKRRNRRNRTERSPIQTSEQNVDIIEIKDSQTNPNNEVKGQSGTPSIRKAIKCPVCLEDFSTFGVANKQLVSTNCGHLFCDRCIKEVIKTSKSCPNCRKKIATQKSFHPIYL